MRLTARFQDALQFATELHAAQFRKGTQVPYVAHLLAVAAIALEHGANEDEAIGALLHDAAEDQGGLATLSKIRERFGTDVAEIVAGCTDSFAEDPSQKPPWRERKEKYIAHLAQASPSVRLISASDKLHNARSILADCRRHGLNCFERFNGGRDGTLWYYRALVTAFRAHSDSPLIDELDRTVAALEQAVRSAGA